MSTASRKTTRSVPYAVMVCATKKNGQILKESTGIKGHKSLSRSFLKLPQS